MARSRSFLTLMVLSAILLVGCGARIQGEVRDGFGASLGGVAVAIPGTQFKAVTDDKGRYEIHYAPGRFKLTFAKEGYLGKTRDLEVVTETRVPAEQIVLIKVPEDVAVHFWGAKHYVRLGAGTLRHSSVEHGFSWDKPLLTDTYMVDGDFVRIEPGPPLRFLDNVPQPLKLFAVGAEGRILVRKKAWLSTKDDATVIEEKNERLAEGLIERTATLPPGRYAFAQVNGSASLGSGGPTFGAIAGHPILAPVFLFELAEGNSVQN